MSFHFTQYEQNHSFHREIMKSYYKVVFHQGEMIFYLASKRFPVSVEKNILIAQLLSWNCFAFDVVLRTLQQSNVTSIYCMNVITVFSILLQIHGILSILLANQKSKEQTTLNKMLTNRHQIIRKRRGYSEFHLQDCLLLVFFSCSDSDTHHTHRSWKYFQSINMFIIKKSIPPCVAGPLASIHTKNYFVSSGWGPGKIKRDFTQPGQLTSDMNTLCFYRRFLKKVRPHQDKPAHLAGPAHLYMSRP